MGESAPRGEGPAGARGSETRQPWPAPRSACARSLGRPPRPARPEALARRRGRNSSHFLCAARYVACLLPDRRAARGGGQAARASPSHVWQLPGLTVLLGIPGPPPLVPGDQTGLSSSPGPAWRPRAPAPPCAAADRTAPRSPLPASRSARPAAGRPSPRHAPYPATAEPWKSPESEFET